jgi:hypothetical protein
MKTWDATFSMQYRPTAGGGAAILNSFNHRLEQPTSLAQINVWMGKYLKKSCSSTVF